MDWVLLLIVLPFAALAWWAGFFATKRMRLEKNRLREEAAQKNLKEKNSAAINLPIDH
ncbi:MAG: hypothetical protein Q9M22_00445 [Mariprofundaceae bacterium]|nr:hypothetical protein [Mariprofundaceae bacterium]